MTQQPSSDPTPSESKDAALADPPSSEAAHSEQPHRTTGLGDALAEPSADPGSRANPTEESR
jgi:hypothetical protein